MKNKIELLVESARDEVSSMLAENLLPQIVEGALVGTAMYASAGVISAALSGVGQIMLGYKQKKTERQLELYVEEIIRNQDVINERLNSIEKSMCDQVKDKYFGLLADYAISAKQEEKIKFIVNGFVNISGGMFANEDIVLLYYDTLDVMNLLDLQVLSVYAGKIQMGDFDEVMSRCGLDYSQLAMVQEKLMRYGLLESKRDATMEENMLRMFDYMEKSAAGKTNVKLKKLKRISRIETYSITSYGRKFLQFFQCDSSGKAV